MLRFAVVVVYDISDDRIRRKVEKICSNFGLAHIQRSAFVGFLDEGKRKELWVALENLILLEDAEGEASIRIFRIRKEDYHRRYIIGRLSGFDDDPEPEEVEVV